LAKALIYVNWKSIRDTRLAETATSPTEPVLRTAAAADGAGVARIYNHHVANTVVTFETEPVEAGEMGRRIEEALDASLPWLVADVAGTVAGFAGASKWKGRCAYRYSVESTVYVDPDHTGRGLGSLLYSKLIDEVRARGMHAMLGGISLPNDASVRLHEKLGFEKVGHFREVGYKFDRWVDVGYWQLIL